MTTKTTPQLAKPPPESTSPGRWLRIARVGAMLVMAFCIVTFVWGVLLFSRYGLANLDAIRPNDNWSDETLLAVIAAAGLSVVRLGYAQLAVDVLAALSMAAVGLVIFWRKADSWFGLYAGVLFVWFGTQANFVTDPVGQVLPFLAPIDSILGNLVWLAFFPPVVSVPRWPLCAALDTLAVAGLAWPDGSVQPATPP